MERTVCHARDMIEYTEHWQWNAARGQVVDWSKVEDLFPNKK